MKARSSIAVACFSSVLEFQTTVTMNFRVFWWPGKTRAADLRLRAQFLRVSCASGVCQRFLFSLINLTAWNGFGIPYAFLDNNGLPTVLLSGYRD